MSVQAIDVKKVIGFLPEDNPLYEEMYVAEYLEYVAGLYRLPHKRESVDTVIKQTGLEPEIHKTIRQLSKGYKQRAGIAQAIIHNPEVLILDESASGLDPNQIDEINALLSTLSAGKAILFSSHTLTEVTAICTRIIIIHQGKIVADKNIQEVDNLEVLFKTLTKS
jgi:ABC-2 type transport system ATP-binding protein